MSLHKKYETLLIERKGRSPQAFMKALNVIQEIRPSQCYEVGHGVLIPTVREPTGMSVESALPRHCVLQGDWCDPREDGVDPSNILGDIGTFMTQDARVAIPIARTAQEDLSYYAAILLRHGSVLRFDTEVPLPFFSMEIGRDYVKDYMLQRRYANGIFLEHHDRPHFHMPLNKEGGGYLILGKKIGRNRYHVSAFSIPYGYAIYTPAGVIHNDSFLVGAYGVVYAQTEHFSTVRLLDASGEMLGVEIVE